MPEVAKAVSNAYVDSATSPFLYDQRVFATVAGTLGAERMLFGSDFPLVRARRVAEQAIATLSPSDAAAVLGGNAQALLDL